MNTDTLERSRGGVWAWLFQRITAVLLFLGLGLHLGATHLFAIGDLSYDNIADRLGSSFFAAVDVVLLAAVLFHALNGFRMVVFDYWFSERGSRTVLTVVLWAIGVAAFVYGMWALWPWIKA